MGVARQLGLAIAATWLLAAGAACAQRDSTFAPVLGQPRLEGPAVVWSRAPVPLDSVARRWRSMLPPPSATVAQQLAAWRALAADSSFAATALRRLALVALDAGDSAAADSAWAALAARRGVWSWEAVRGRTSLAFARRDGERAWQVLEAADTTGWPDFELSAWFARRAEMHALRGDTPGALALARLGLARHPTTVSAAALVVVLDRELGSRETIDDLEAGAVADSARGHASEAATRLARALALVPRTAKAERFALSLRRAALMRIAGARGSAAALSGAATLATSPADRAALLLEQARRARAAKDLTLAAWRFAAAGALVSGTRLAKVAWLEAADADERRLAWSDAARAWSHLGDDSTAALREGLTWLGAGDTAAAGAALARARGEPAEFWRAVLRRRRGGPGADSLLRAIAERPGWTFHRVAARESLGIPAWPPTAVATADEVDPALTLAWRLFQIGLWPDATSLLERWWAGDRRLGDGAAPRDPRAPLQAARIAYAIGRYPLATELARRAFGAADAPAGRAALIAAAPFVMSPDAGDRLAWGIAAWIHPPALDSLFAAWPDSGDVDRALLRALVWQESRFNARARSSSDALGLTQLKQSTAAELARAAHEPVPDEEALLDPATSLHFGSRYLRTWLVRFGSPVLALAAYNGGPGAVSRWWAAGGHEVEARGGWALVSELVVRPETEGYVQTILALRAGYRALAPRARP